MYAVPQINLFKNTWLMASDNKVHVFIRRCQKISRGAVIQNTLTLLLWNEPWITQQRNDRATRHRIARSKHFFENRENIYWLIPSNHDLPYGVTLLNNVSPLINQSGGSARSQEIKLETISKPFLPFKHGKMCHFNVIFCYWCARICGSEINQYFETKYSAVW